MCFYFAARKNQFEMGIKPALDRGMVSCVFVCLVGSATKSPTNLRRALIFGRVREQLGIRKHEGVWLCYENIE